MRCVQLTQADAQNLAKGYVVLKSSQRSLLAVLAHPDDETFGCGGTLAKYAASGVDLTLICATRGEVGEISNSSLATSSNLGRVREEELRAACDILGVRELYLLGYRDSGVVGTPDNNHPEALCRASRGEVAGRIVEIIRKVRPQVVVTFDQKGGYGHPDHIAIHQATHDAFRAAGSESSSSQMSLDEPQPHQPSKLYYMTFPRSMFREFQKAIVSEGIDSDLAKMDVETMGTPDEEVTTVIDVSEFAEVKEKAALCHRTQLQGEGVFDWLPSSLRQRFLSTEYLVRDYPPSKGGDDVEMDLFGAVGALGA